MLEKLVKLENKNNYRFFEHFRLNSLQKMKILIILIRRIEHDFRKKIRIRGKNLKFWKL